MLDIAVTLVLGWRS